MQRVVSLDPTIKLHTYYDGVAVVIPYYHYTISTDAIERQQYLEYQEGIPSYLEYLYSLRFFETQAIMPAGSNEEGGQKFAKAPE